MKDLKRGHFQNSCKFQHRRSNFPDKASSTSHETHQDHDDNAGKFTAPFNGFTRVPGVAVLPLDELPRAPIQQGFENPHAGSGRGSVRLTVVHQFPSRAARNRPRHERGGQKGTCIPMRDAGTTREKRANADEGQGRSRAIFQCEGSTNKLMMVSYQSLFLSGCCWASSEVGYVIGKGSSSEGKESSSRTSQRRDLSPSSICGEF